MKRHGMKGQPASHGVSKTHRKMGATGGGQVQCHLASFPGPTLRGLGTRLVHASLILRLPSSIIMLLVVGKSGEGVVHNLT